MDGHGLKGHLVTEYMSQQLVQRLAEQLENSTPQVEWEEKMKALCNFQVESNLEQEENHARIHDSLRHAFHQTHVDAVNAMDVPAGRSGTTCIACLIDDSHIHVAHVGDSRAILVRPTTASDNPSSLPFQVLTTETTVANLPEDAERVKAGEGRMDGQGNVWYGPVGISMTRALGDAVMLRAGVVPTPLVESHCREPGSFLVIATDGVFDVLSNEVVSKIVQESSSSVETIVENLAARARQGWIGDLPLMEEKIDDITCVVAHIP